MKTLGEGVRLALNWRAQPSHLLLFVIFKHGDVNAVYGEISLQFSKWLQGPFFIFYVHFYRRRLSFIQNHITSGCHPLDSCDDNTRHKHVKVNYAVMLIGSRITNGSFALQCTPLAPTTIQSIPPPPPPPHHHTRLSPCLH